MGETGPLEVLDRGAVDPVVLAEHETARQGGLGRRHAAVERRLGAIADAVGDRGQSAAAPTGEPDPVRLQDLADPVPRQVADLPIRRLAEHPAGTDLATDREVRDRLGRLDEEAAVGAVDPHRDDPVVAPRDRGDEAAHARGATVRPLERAGVDRGEPLAARDEANRGRDHAHHGAGANRPWPGARTTTSHRRRGAERGPETGRDTARHPHPRRHSDPGGCPDEPDQPPVHVGQRSASGRAGGARSGAQSCRSRA